MKYPHASITTLNKIFNPISMKTSICIMGMAVLFSSASFSQPSPELGLSIGGGLNTQGTGTVKAAIELRQWGWHNAELSVAVNGGKNILHSHWNEVYGFQYGYVFELKHTDLRVAPGLFYHTGLLSKTEDTRCPMLLPGGSVRWQRRFGAFSLGTDGETVQMKIEMLLSFKL